MYKKITDKDVKALKEIFGDNNTYVGDEIAEEYAKDEIGLIVAYPEVRVVAKNKEQVSKVMKYAHKENIPVTVRGAGTGLVGGAVPVLGGILLDLSGMDKILELDHTNMTLKVQPGVLMLDIYEEVLKHDLFYGPDPGEKTATIGGTISTNAGGMRAIKYGTTREWVRGLEVVLANGEVINVGGKVVKNSSGYPLKELFIGTEGTLGIIVEATLKLTSLPKYSTSLLVPFKNTATAVKAAAQLIEKHVTPTAVEYVNQPSLKYSKEFLGKHMPHDIYDAYLLLSYDGTSKDALRKDIDRASELCMELGAIDVYLIDTDERNSSVWTIRGAFLEAIKASTPLMDELDVVVPRAVIPEYLEYTEEVSKKLGIRMPYFGHVGDGNLHIYFCKDDMDLKVFEEKLDEAFDLMYSKAFSLGGLTSGEHAVGYLKKEYLATQIGSTQLELMKGIKRLFDPKNILNPSKIVDI
ncbi:MAG TPA: FAD-binding oxidoreductase [Acholeplasma sp.]|jgi:glycolate oxidase|nr:FAD-binding oxidoreductase [Acholeplasma sp.]